jgi:hypothetical protein
MKTYLIYDVPIGVEGSSGLSMFVIDLEEVPMVMRFGVEDYLHTAYRFDPDHHRMNFFFSEEEKNNVLQHYREICHLSKGYSGPHNQWVRDFLWDKLGKELRNVNN